MEFGARTRSSVVACQECIGSASGRALFKLSIDASSIVRLNDDMITINHAIILFRFSQVMPKAHEPPKT